MATVMKRTIELDNARRPGIARGWAAWLPLAILPAVVFVVARDWPAWVFMWGLAVSIYVGLKWLTFADQAPQPGMTSRRRAFGYLFAWPGLDAERFLCGKQVTTIRHGEWLIALLTTAMGVAAFALAALKVGDWPDLPVGWLGMVGVVFSLHFGLFHILSLCWRSVGVDATLLMNWPIAASSLADFWGRRWNVAFRDVSFRYLYRPLVRRIGHGGALLAVFAVSGLVHDAVISIPAEEGYGGPTLYFLLQGIGLLSEQSHRGRGLGLGWGIAGRVSCLVTVAAPLPLLFHRPFVDSVILPMLRVAASGGGDIAAFVLEMF